MNNSNFRVKNNLLTVYKSQNKLKKAVFIVNPPEENLIKEFVCVFLGMNKKDQGKIQSMKKKYTIKRLLYYSNVWTHTRNNINKAANNNAIDHIVPISKGFVLDIPEYLIGGTENLQEIPSIKNLNKGISITDKAKDILNKWDSQGNKHISKK